MNTQSRSPSTAVPPCPFCGQGVSQGNPTNLSQHVRYRHPEKFEAWRDANIEAALNEVRRG